MSTPIHALVSGNFTSDGTIRTISLPSGFDSFELIDTLATDYTTAGSTSIFRSRATSLMPADSGFVSTGSGANSILTETFTSSGGFTFVADNSTLLNGPAIAVTSITAASPAVVATGTTTGLVAGSSVVRIINETSMKQISSMDFTIGTISAGVSFQLQNMNTTGFVAGTTGFYRLINARAAYYPKRRYITNISKAASAIITMSVTHGFTVGQAVRIYVPSKFGMTEMNGLLGNITAIGAADASTYTNTITVDINSSGFTTFAFPLTADAQAGTTFPQVVPVGEDAVNSVSQPFGNLLDDATVNQSVTGVQIGTSVQTSGVTYQWLARRGVSV